MRWSYLGEEWEAEEAPQALLDAAQSDLAENEWTRDADGTWRVTSEVKPDTAEEETKDPETSQAEQPSPPKPDGTDEPRPEWTSGWKPGWKEPFE